MALIYDLANVFKKWCKELMGKYHGLFVNLANAPLVVVAGTENIRAVLCSTRTSKSLGQNRKGFFRLLPQRLHYSNIFLKNSATGSSPREGSGCKIKR